MALEGIAASDFHLMGMKTALNNATEKQVIEIKKLFDYAIENGIRHVFIPGDISDTANLDDHTFIALLMLLLQYDEHLCIYYMLGNHDVEHSKKTSLDVLRILATNGFFKNFKLFFSPETLKIDGVNVCFMPYPHTNVLKSSKPPLVFAHVETAGAIGDNGRALKVHKESLVRVEGDYVISGHIHQYQVLKNKRFLYCGNLYQKNFGEALPKGFVRFTAKYVQGKLIVKHEFVNSRPNFVLETRVINDQSEFDSLESNENIRYKLLVAEGVTVPKNLIRDIPNIVYVNGSTSRVKVTADGQTIEGGVTIRDLPAFSIRTGLQRYLKSAEFDAAKIKRAKRLVTEAQKALGIY